MALCLFPSSKTRNKVCAYSKYVLNFSVHLNPCLQYARLVCTLDKFMCSGVLITMINWIMLRNIMGELNSVWNWHDRLSKHDPLVFAVYRAVSHSNSWVITMHPPPDIKFACAHGPFHPGMHSTDLGISGTLALRLTATFTWASVTSRENSCSQTPHIIIIII